MADDAPPVIKLSDKRQRLLGIKAPRFQEANLRSVSEYFAKVVEPRLREEQTQKVPQVNLAYPAMKKGRGPR